MIEVSICCITYNHEKYITKTLDGFFSQKCDFDFEILIHDDCSTDHTTEIIRKYLEKYPGRITLIVEEENQYSKNIKMINKMVLSANGKYIAICEGDDYWCDENKLQKQYDYMLLHKECTYLVHAAYLMDYRKKRKGLIRPYKGDSQISLNSVLKEGTQFPTASIFTRREYMLTMPEFYENAPIEDEPIKLLCLSKGEGYYIDKPMCVYRQGHEGSWNATVKADRSKRIKHHREKIRMYESFDEYTGYLYHGEVDAAIGLEELNIVLANEDYKALRDKKYKRILSRLGFVHKYRLYFAARFPHLYYFMKRAILLCR